MTNEPTKQDVPVCAFIYKGGAMCGYPKSAPMHTESDSPVWPDAGRHAFQPAQAEASEAKPSSEYIQTTGHVSCIRCDWSAEAGDEWSDRLNQHLADKHPNWQSDDLVLGGRGVWKPEAVREGTRVSMRPSFVSQEYREALAEKGIEIEGFPAAPPAPREEVALPQKWTPDPVEWMTTIRNLLFALGMKEEMSNWSGDFDGWGAAFEWIRFHVKRSKAREAAMRSALSAPTLDAARKILREALGE